MRLLVIGQLNSHVSLAVRIAREKGANVTSADTAARALSHLRLYGADLILIDVNLAIRDFVLALKDERIATPVMTFGTTADAGLAASSIRAGARDYLPFPPDPELIGAIITSISEHRKPMIAHDPAMLNVIASAEKIAPSDASVMITGESGTGKEVVSRFIHERSKRAHHPFISLNCAAIPEQLLESELFGHEKGAFTGAISRRIGKFEEAQGGTLLLDEISEMSISLQAKLLRAIQERIIERVGSNKPVPVNIRILATSNRNIQESIRKREFREDLYYRLNVVTLCIPPLRERKQDILALTEHFCQKYCELNGLPLKYLSTAVADKLCGYAWPGNVRELENIVHRSVLLSSGPELEVDLAHSVERRVSLDDSEITRHASEVAASFTHSLVGKTIDEVEQDLILSTLESCRGNRTHAARVLGISIRTLRNKLNYYVDTGRVPDAGFKIP